MRWSAPFAALGLTLGLTFGLTVSLALPVLAEEPAQKQAPKSGRLDEVLVTATSHESRVDAVPNAVTVITREQIDQMVAPTTIDILKNAAGVEVYSARGPLSSSTYNRVIMRGQGSNPARILVMLNGIPQAGGQNGDFEWSFINPRDVERIEIVRGPGSALYGSQAMGGVINIITRKPTEADGKTVLETKYGSLNTMSASAYHSRKEGDWGFYGSATVGGTDGYQVVPGDQVVYKAQGATNSDKLRSANDWGRGVVSYDIDKTSGLTLNMMHGHFLNQGMYNFMHEFTAFEMAKKQADLSYAKKFTGGQVLAYASAAYQYSTYDGTSSSAPYNNMAKTGESPAYQRDYQSGLKATMDVGLGNTLSAGMDLKRTSYDRRYDNYGMAGSNYGSAGGDAQVWGAFLQDELNLFDGRLLITPGVRYENTSLFDGYAEQLPTVTRREMSRTLLRSFTGRVGARLNVVDWLSFRSAFGEAFRAPTLSELYGASRIGTSTYYGNTDLKPERMRSLEGGVDITPLDDLRISLTVYKNHAVDYIDNVLVAAGTYNKKNIGTVDTGGFEGEISYTFLEHWRSFLNHQQCDPKLMSGSYVGQRITGTPTMTTSIGLAFSDPKLFNLSVVNRRVGRIYNNSANSQVYGNYDVVDAKLSKAFALEASKLELSLEVSNLFDVRVRETSGTQAPGSLYTAGVAWIF
jgi:outer membrane cobalamin receptor